MGRTAKVLMAAISVALFVIARADVVDVTDDLLPMLTGDGGDGGDSCFDYGAEDDMVGANRSHSCSLRTF